MVGLNESSRNRSAVSNRPSGGTREGSVYGGIRMERLRDFKSSAWTEIRRSQCRPPVGWMDCPCRKNHHGFAPPLNYRVNVFARGPGCCCPPRQSWFVSVQDQSVHWLCRLLRSLCLFASNWTDGRAYALCPCQKDVFSRPQLLPGKVDRQEACR